jgi:hypothetical protein
MSVGSRVETDEDLQLVKDHVLFPILLDMINRDIDRLKIYSDGIVFNHVIFYLREMENLVFPELQRVKHQMRKRDVRILNEEKGVIGIEVEYKVRGYIHNFTMLRSLVKAELMMTLMNLRRRL